MVNWYDVRQLASTGVKTVISGIFGNFADKREFQAAFSPNEKEHDFSEKEGYDEIWIDYIADLGDGFNSTYTMAHLMAKDKFDLDDHRTKRGSILIMGGDEVYPTPEMVEYDNRLKGPYNAAFPWKDEDEKRPRLFAIPGNHDWYDGLTNFTKVFFQERAFGNWHTKQKRSYFAIKLPQNYWMLGLDIQLNADIDAPQKEFFQKIAREKIQAGDKIILCTAEPTWVYESWAHKEKSEDRIRFFINKVLHGEDEKYYGRSGNKAKLVAVLTGDLHHYSRYEEKAKQEKNDKQVGETCQLITAGGGGAFTHPTHFLKKKIDLKDGGTRTLMSEPFPSKKQSIRLGFWNLLFPFFSFTMMAFFGIFHLLTTWFLESNTTNVWCPCENGTFIDHILEVSGLREFLIIIGQSIGHNPSAMLFNLVLFFGIVAFTDASTGKGNWNYIVGVIHGLLHVINLYFLIWLFTSVNDVLMPDLLPNDFWKMFSFSMEMIVVGGFISSFIFGIYLFVSTLIIKNHPTEAFSSFRWTGYKNFLRIHIDKNGVAKVYPVGVKKVVTNWKNVGTEDKPKFAGQEPSCQLIEDPFEL